MAKKKKRPSQASREEARRGAENQRSEPANRRASSKQEAAYRRKAAQLEASRRQNRSAYMPQKKRPRSPGEEAVERRRQASRSQDPRVRQMEEAKKQQRRRKQQKARNAQRHRNKAKNRRRNLWIFRVLTWVIVLIAGYFGATVFFKIDTITIKGETRYSQEELLDTLGITKGDNLFFIDREAAKKRMLDQYLYLEDIKLKRKLPSTLEVQLTESKASAAAQAEDGYFLLDKNGKILEQVEEVEAKKYTLLFGLNTQGLKAGDKLTESGDERTKTLFHLVAMLDEKDMSAKTTFIDVEKISSINIGYDGRFIVNFGTVENLDQKIRFLKTITAERLTPSDTGLIDISEVKTARFRPLSTLTGTELSRMRNFDGTKRSDSQTTDGETHKEETSDT